MSRIRKCASALNCQPRPWAEAPGNPPSQSAHLRRGIQPPGRVATASPPSLLVAYQVVATPGDRKYSLPGGMALWNLSHCGGRSNACSVPVGFVIQLVSARSQLVRTVINDEGIDCVYENRRHSVEEAKGLLPAAPGERSESGHSGLWRPGVSHAIRAFNRLFATYF
jgi:hypothetical protein